MQKIAFFDLLPVEIRSIIYHFSENKDLLSMSALNSKYKKELDNFWVIKLAKESFYICKPDESPKKLYLRLQYLKQLFIEAEHFSRKFFGYEDNCGFRTINQSHYNENLAQKIIDNIPVSERIETRLQKYINNGEFDRRSLFDILRRSGKYKKNDEYIVLQTPYLVNFLRSTDFSVIFQSKINFDRKAFNDFMKVPQLVLQMNPILFADFISTHNAYEIISRHVIGNKEIQDHLCQVESFVNYLDKHFFDRNNSKRYKTQDIIPFDEETDVDDKIESQDIEKADEETSYASLSSK